MKVIWGILCQSSVIDRQTNNVSLFNVIEEISIPAQPPQMQPGQPWPTDVAPLMFDLVILWMRSDEDTPERGRGRVRLVVPNQKAPALGQEFEVDLTNYLRLRMVLKVPGLPAGDLGMYRFIVDGKTDTSDWAEMFELPIRVALHPQASA